MDIKKNETLDELLKRLGSEQQPELKKETDDNRQLIKTKEEER